MGRFASTAGATSPVLGAPRQDVSIPAGSSDGMPVRERRATAVEYVLVVTMSAAPSLISSVCQEYNH